MAFGLRGGMGVEIRKALREKWALKLGLVSVAFHSCDTHDCDSHGNRGGGGGAPDWMSDGDKRIYNKLKGSVQADFLAKAEAAYKKTHGKAPPKGKGKARKPAAKKPVAAQAAHSTPELVEQRRKYIVDKKGWKSFPGEVGDQMGKDVQILNSQIRAEHWLTKAQFLKLKGRNRDGKLVSALEQCAGPACHGHVVERGGRFLNPFGAPDGPGHVAYRLEQFDMAGEMLDKGGLASRIKNEPAFSVELKKPEIMPNGKPRAKNQIYLMSGGGSGSRAVALNVVVEGTHVTAALVEWADGNFADLGSIRRALGKSQTLTNTVIPVKDF